MNRLHILLALGLLISANSWAQDDQKQKPDTTKVQIGDLNVIIYEDPDKDSDERIEVNLSDDDHDSKAELTHWGGIDLGVNMLFGADGNTDLGDGNEWLDLNPARSLSWNFNIYEEKIRIARDYIGIITGLGLSYNSYGLSDSVTVNNKFVSTNDQGAMSTIDSTNGVFNGGIELTKNKLRTSSLHVPVLLEINTNKSNDKSFHLAAGFIGGWRFSTVTKQKWSTNGIAHESRRKGDFNTRDFTLDATVRVGYKNFTIYALYGLTPLFVDGKGPEVYPVSVGLSVIPF